MYLACSAPATYGTIVRIDTLNDIESEITMPGAERNYCVTTLGGTNTTCFAGKLIGTKLYVGCSTQHESIFVIQNAAGATFGQIREITGLPNRTYEIVDPQGVAFPSSPTTHPNWSWEGSGGMYQHRTIQVGAKLYMSSASYSGATIVIINTNANWPDNSTVSQPACPNRTHYAYFVNGNRAYLLTITSATDITLWNTDNDTYTSITGLTSRGYTFGSESGTGANRRLYIGASWAYGFPEINLSNNTLVKDWNEFPYGTYNLVYGDPTRGKIYPFGSGSRAALWIFTDSMLPTHPQPVYIRPD
jgi:hypothetical protein